VAKDVCIQIFAALRHITVDIPLGTNSSLFRLFADSNLALFPLTASNLLVQGILHFM